ncbi:MAG TPA: 50S ribosomal protein L30e [Candidatus Thermoplasmatota archaeon]|nr:50S ribosomal protein L30e [Candidatus Thermoplasmatota archaeon]
MDVNRALRSATQSGKVGLGVNETLKAVTAKQAKLIVLSSNAPSEAVDQVTKLATKNKVPIYKFAGTNAELGPACGKPFSVSMLSVLEAGESDVLALAREG